MIVPFALFVLFVSFEDIECILRTLGRVSRHFLRKDCYDTLCVLGHARHRSGAYFGRCGRFCVDDLEYRRRWCKEIGEQAKVGPCWEQVMPMIGVVGVGSIACDLDVGFYVFVLQEGDTYDLLFGLYGAVSKGGEMCQNPFPLPNLQI